MPRRLFIIFIAAVFCIAAVLSSCAKNDPGTQGEMTETAATSDVSSESTQNGSDLNESAGYAVSAETYVDEIGADDGGILVTIDISVPHVEGTGENEMNINDYYDNIYEKEINYAAIDLATLAQDAVTTSGGENFRPYYFASYYHVTRNDDLAFSVVRSTSEFTGGVSESERMAAETFFMSGGKAALSDIFKVGQDEYMKVITGKVREKIKKAPDDYFPNAAEDIENVYDTGDFYLTNDALVVFFNTYAIAPYTTGIVTVEIPYEEISEMLSLAF